MARQPIQQNAASQSANEAKIATLRAALDEGLASGIYDGDPFEDALAEIDRMDAKP